jgi:hypothetical protein
MCLNAVISNQFEVVQQTWLNSSKFNRLYDEVDPLVGIGPLQGGACSYTIPGIPVRERIAGVPRFIDVRGGAYFFMPGISALAQIANLG